MSSKGFKNIPEIYKEYGYDDKEYFLEKEEFEKRKERLKAFNKKSKNWFLISPYVDDYEHLIDVYGAYKKKYKGLNKSMKSINDFAIDYFLDGEKE